MKAGDFIRNKLRSFLRLEPADRLAFSVKEELDFAGTAYMHKLWYRGSASELSQFYREMPDGGGRFWHCSATSGLEIRRVHTGIPKIMVNKLAGIAAGDFNGVTVSGSGAHIWEEIARENNIRALIQQAVTDMLVVGDGAFKVSLDPEVSELPVLEWYSGDQVEFVRRRGRIREIVFSTPYFEGGVPFVLEEHYGFGYVRYELFRGTERRQVPLGSLKATERLTDVAFDDSFMMACAMMTHPSEQFRGRGQSIFDGKTDAFDALDETYSQWLQAQRQSRPTTYMPDRLIPRDPNSGRLIKPNSFDNRFVTLNSNVAEGAQDKVTVEQPVFPAEAYNSTYITALDLALQGVISPSTLGIDVKKLDNAEAQREKEKTTLYTRADIIEALTGALGELAKSAVRAYLTGAGQPLAGAVDSVEVKFGGYANPSFEAQIETLSNPNAPMSIEAKVEELWGDSKDDVWKQDEVARIKEQSGVAELDEPSFGGGFPGPAQADESAGADDGAAVAPAVTSTLNGAQIGSLMNMIAMVKAGTITRNEGIAIVTSTLGIDRAVAETYFEQV